MLLYVEVEYVAAYHEPAKRLGTAVWFRRPSSAGDVWISDKGANTAGFWEPAK